MRIVKMFLPENALNVVTAYYISLIESALKYNGNLVVRVGKLEEVDYGDLVVTIVPLDAVKLLLLRRAKIINWFQGIGPEEYRLLHSEDKNAFRVHIVSLILELAEKYALKKSLKCLFVSESMAKHYKKKYNLTNISYISVPCYNIGSRRSSFAERYTEPNFIYAGSTLAWQKFEKTLDIFKEIQKLLPTAHLAIMTQNKESAQKMVDSRELKNVVIDYVSQAEVDSLMLKYKYAFLIRDDIPINRVATPTKMASYISSGLIPIYSNVIDAFEENIKLGDFGVSISGSASPKQVALQVVYHHEKTKIGVNIEDMSQTHQYIFDTYYSDSLNISKISDYLKET